MNTIVNILYLKNIMSINLSSYFQVKIFKDGKLEVYLIKIEKKMWKEIPGLLNYEKKLIKNNYIGSIYLKNYKISYLSNNM
jgi:hypothetical protein